MDNQLGYVCANLDVLASIEPYDKLRIVSKDEKSNPDSLLFALDTHTLNIDQRYVPSVMRTVTGDSKASTLAFIKNVLDALDEIAQVAYRSYNEQQHRLGAPEEEDTLFVRRPCDVLDTLVTKLRMATEGVRRLKTTTYLTDRQFCLDLKCNVIDRAEFIIQNIKVFFVTAKCVTTESNPRLR